MGIEKAPKVTSRCDICHWENTKPTEDKKYLHNITDEYGMTIKLLCDVCYQKHNTVISNKTPLKEIKGIVIQYWDGSDQVYKLFVGKKARESSEELILNLLNAGHHEVRIINHMENISVRNWKENKQQIEKDK